jgi:heptosyltransferase-2
MEALEIIKVAGRRAVGSLSSPRAALLLAEPFFWVLGMRRKRQEFDLSRVKRALVVRLDEIGDVVMTTPFLRELRRNLPRAWITLVVKPGVRNLVELCPYVNEVLTYDWNISDRLRRLRRHGRALNLACQRLWRRRFDLAIVPRWDADHYHATFLAYFSGAPWRVGYSEDVIPHKRQHNRGLDRLLTHALNDDAVKHEVERSLDLLRFLGATVQDDRLELWLGEEDEAFADSVLRRHGLESGEPLVGLCPSGGNSRLKQWSASRFIELARWLLSRHGARIVIVGGPGEEALGQQIERGLGPSAINAVGKTTLRQLAALLRRCRLYIGNDAGPTHIAAAMGTPLVALFGPTCHHRFRPWGERQEVLWLGLPCSPCLAGQHIDRCPECVFDFPRCMLDITVEQAKAAVDEQLRESHAASAEALAHAAP